MIKYMDPETGFLYLRARYYDPTTAQFLTPDPLFAITGSRYGYAGNDPINGDDPTGLCGPFGNGACPGASTVRHIAHSVNNDVAQPVERAYHGAQNLCVANGTSCKSLASQHPEATDLLYLTAGVAATVASGGLLAEALGPEVLAGGEIISTPIAGGLSSTAGGIAAWGDHGRCIHDHDHLACAGFYSGLGGAAAGIPAVLGGESLLGLGFGTFGIVGGMIGAAGDSAALINELRGQCS